jgi:hypothetical protein
VAFLRQHEAIRSRGFASKSCAALLPTTRVSIASRHWGSLGPWSDRVRLAGSLTRCDGGIPDPPEGYAGAVVGLRQYPESPIRRPSCVHAATVQSPSSVPHPVAIRTSNGR